jgi:hypothetical protein
MTITRTLTRLTNDERMTNSDEKKTQENSISKCDNNKSNQIKKVVFY